MLWITEQAQAEKSIKELNMPLLFIEAEKEDVVSNDYIKKYASMAPNPNNQNEYVSIKDCDHSLTCFDPVYGS